MNPELLVLAACPSHQQIVACPEANQALRLLRSEVGPIARWQFVEHGMNPPWLALHEAFQSLPPEVTHVLLVANLWVVLAPGSVRSLLSALIENPALHAVYPPLLDSIEYEKAGNPQCLDALRGLAAAGRSSSQAQALGEPAVALVSVVSRKTGVAAPTSTPGLTDLLAQAYPVPGTCVAVLPDFHGSARLEVLPLLPTRASTVLDLGCGDGAFGAAVQSRTPAVVTGIELNLDAALRATRRLNRVLHADLATVDLNGQFDVVTALDILEHLSDPEAALQRIRDEWLAPGGTLIVSLPNTGHWSVVADLLAGRSTPLPAGVLCITHRRSFTPDSARQWLESHGFRILAEHPIRSSVPLSFADAFHAAETTGMTVAWESLGTLQFLLVAQKQTESPKSPS